MWADGQQLKGWSCHSGNPILWMLRVRLRITFRRKVDTPGYTPGPADDPARAT